MTKRLRHGSLFTGVGGVDLGLEWAGYQVVWQVEISPFSRRVLDKHWSHVQKLSDVRECGKHNLEPVDIITGSFPCQQISCAGRREGIGTAESPTERSGLWFEQRRIIAELRPQWVLIENVPRLLETADGETVLEGLEEIGYSWWSLLMDAGTLGAPHRRERAWILCRKKTRDYFDFEEVIAETGALPPECQQRMKEALGKWNYWKHELGRGAAEVCPAITTTPTATAVLEAQWPGRRIYQNSEGRWRKRSKQGTDGSASWVQEMLVRAVAQKNLRLTPTPESCEEFMGFPAGWTDLGGESTGCPKGWVSFGRKESDADAYAEIVRGVHGIPNWEDRLKALGNAVVPQIAMLVGACVQRSELLLDVRKARLALPGPRHDGGGGGIGARRRSGSEPGIRPSPQEGAGPGSGCPESGGCTINRAWEKPEPADICPGVKIARDSGRELHARTMGDAELCEFIAGALSPVKRILRNVLPYLAEARRRFAQPGRRVPVPGRPTWGEWVRQSIGISDRHARRLLAGEREPQGGSGGPKQVKLDDRQQAALVRAQMAANDLAVALRDGAEWDPALAEFERVAISPAVLGAWSDAASRQPDWKTALVKLVDALEPCGESLPASVRSALRSAEALLGGWTGTLATGMGKETPARGVRPSAPVNEQDGDWHGMPIPACVPGTTT